MCPSCQSFFAVAHLKRMVDGCVELLHTVGKIDTSTKHFFGPLQRPNGNSSFGIVRPHNLDIWSNFLKGRYLHKITRKKIIYAPPMSKLGALTVLELTAQHELSFVDQMDGEEEGCSIYQREGLCCL